MPHQPRTSPSPLMIIDARVNVTERNEGTTSWKITERRIKEPRRDITCFKCREIGHIARQYLSERKLKKDFEERHNVGSDSSDTFNEFTYEEEVLDEIEGYHTEESATEEIGLYDNPWADIESPGIYLTAIDKPPNQTEEPPKRTSNEYLDEIIQDKDLDEIQNEQARQFFCHEKGLFAQST
ncbi:42766_t:CDS:2 [Gigaspora margarita]|uniref:42766_t:CDS:1 n=1 Tax=Gigaspora margarita TaxID=4874 RepID=A0ABM8VVP2_GIGMA|nr:42766_t:CDS:2 [Gigaspora margarita]